MGALGRVLGQGSWGPPGGLLGASWARLGAPWARPGASLGPPGRLLGAWGRLQGALEAENNVKPTYFHVFCMVSGGPGDPQKFVAPGSDTVNLARFGPGALAY